MKRVMGESAQEAEAEELEARYYRRMHFNNLVSRAEWMEQKGQHLKQHITRITPTDIVTELKELAYTMNVTTESRHRMAKEIAEELIVEHGATAHFYCVEKLANSTAAPKLWRDVLTYLDEIEVKHGGERRHENTESDS
jgi:hypothetical protein